MSKVEGLYKITHEWFSIYYKDGSRTGGCCTLRETLSERQTICTSTGYVPMLLAPMELVKW